MVTAQHLCSVAAWCEVYGRAVTALYAMIADISDHSSMSVVTSIHHKSACLGQVPHGSAMTTMLPLIHPTSDC